MTFFSSDLRRWWKQNGRRTVWKLRGFKLKKKSLNGEYWWFVFGQSACHLIIFITVPLAMWPLTMHGSYLWKYSTISVTHLAYFYHVVFWHDKTHTKIQYSEMNLTWEYSLTNGLLYLHLKFLNLVVLTEYFLYL